MSDIFLKIAEMIKRKETKQTEVAENLGINQSYLSQVLKGDGNPSKTLTKLADILYGEAEPKKKQSPCIQKINLLLEDMDEEAQEDIHLSVQKEKLLRDLIKERQEKIAA